MKDLASYLRFYPVCDILTLLLVPPGRCHYNFLLKYARTASFHIFSNSKCTFILSFNAL
jgi:hypothetical protein